MSANLAITDFPDRLSPMVVKELRQGLRTRMFGLVLVVLHLLLILFTLMSGGSSNAATINGWFDGIITLTLCVILPLRGFSAVADELKAGTLDMLALTSLSAGRIIFGKWASIASQSLLIAMSILPYVVARYVFGGLDLFGEVAALFYKWLVGVTLASVIIALSTQRQFWLRAVIVGLPLLISGCGMFSFMIMRSMGGPGTSSGIFGLMASGGSRWDMLPLIALGLGAWLVFYFLSLAATRIAPAASQLAVVKRTVHLAFFSLLMILSVTTSLGSGARMVASSMLWLVMMDALTEHVNEVPVVYAAFYRRGWMGRAALWLLAPGWVTGFVFTLLLTALAAGMIAWTGGFDEPRLVVVSACGTWMIAALIQLLPTRHARDLLLPFICISLGVNFLFSMLASLLVLPFTVKTTTAWFTVALPQFVPMGWATAQSGDKPALLDLGMWISLSWPMVLLVLAVFAWKKSRSARQEAWRMTHSATGGPV